METTMASAKCSPYGFGLAFSCEAFIKHTELNDGDTKFELQQWVDAQVPLQERTAHAHLQWLLNLHSDQRWNFYCEQTHYTHQAKLDK
eukprot:4554728-Amphidinium_carterae.1